MSSVRRNAGALEVRVFNPTGSEHDGAARRAGRGGWWTYAGRPVAPFEGSFDLRPHGIATARLDSTAEPGQAAVGSQPRPPRSPRVRRARGGPRPAAPTAWCAGVSDPGSVPARRSFHIWMRPRSLSVRVRSGRVSMPVDALGRQRVAELVGHQDRARVGHVDQTAGQVDHRAVVVAVLDQHRARRRAPPGRRRGARRRHRPRPGSVRSGRHLTAVGTTNMTSSPIIFTTRPPRATTVSWASSSKRATTAASSSSPRCWLSMVNPTMSANPTAMIGRIPSSAPRVRWSMARRVAACRWRRHTYSRIRPIAGIEVPALTSELVGVEDAVARSRP